MSPRLRRRSAREVLAVLQGFGFEVVATRGSLVKLDPDETLGRFRKPAFTHALVILHSSLVNSS